MFKPSAIYYEENAKNYFLGNKLLKQYNDVPQFVIDNHNNIEVMRKKENKEFASLKQNLIIGVRKTQNFVPNYKTSDFLVPYTSSRLYCYVYVLLLGL